MKSITFKKNGDPLKVSFKFNGLAEVGYEYILFEKNGRDIAEPEQYGDIVNNQTRKYTLPSPIEKNDKRRIRLKSKIKASDKDNFPNFKITVSVFQGDTKLGEEIENIELSSTYVDSVIRVELKSN